MSRSYLYIFLGLCAESALLRPELGQHSFVCTTTLLLRFAIGDKIHITRYVSVHFKVCISVYSV